MLGVLGREEKGRLRVRRNLAPGVGLEPTTLPLTAACSTIELARNKKLDDLFYQMAARRVKIGKETQREADRIS